MTTAASNFAPDSAESATTATINPAPEDPHPVCTYCDQEIEDEDDIGYREDSVILCRHCYQNEYTHCANCGRLILIENAYSTDYNDEYYCCDCYYNDEPEPAYHDRVIHDYGYQPEPIFYSTDKDLVSFTDSNGDSTVILSPLTRYMGVELEIDCAGEDDESAEEILSESNYDGIERLYIKHDGSLNEGMELVTHPMTLDYHCTVMPWADIVHRARALGYLSHQAMTCGLHVHVNRNSFGTDEYRQDVCIARILYFFEKHWEELLKFSRRTPRQLERWAARYGLKEQPKEILDHAKKGYHGGRYMCVNLQNRNTIEFRMFRGTLKYNTIIATLQLVTKICDLACDLSDEEMKNLSWTTFAESCYEPELIQYLKERRLYVNDPVRDMEEVDRKSVV